MLVSTGRMKALRSLAVFCGSSHRVAEGHRRAAAELGAAIAGRGIRLVYGGGRVGLMGVLADAALAAGGEVVGVIPDFLFDLEVGHSGLSELSRVGSMHERKRRMSDLADGFVALSGGLGTLDETIEVVTWKQLGLHDKPIVILNLDGLWDLFSLHVERLITSGFAHPGHAGLFTLVRTVDEVFESLSSTAEPAVAADLKWT